MEDHIFFRDTNGVKLAGLLSEVSKNVVILVHGFRGSKEGQTVSTLKKKLNPLGISTFRFDTFAHGESEGKFEEMTVSKSAAGVIAAIDFLRDLGFEKIGLVGSSYGGILSMIAAKERKVDFLVLKAPVSDYPAIERERKDMDQWREQGYIETTTRAGNVYRQNYAFYEDGLSYVAYDFVNEIEVPTFIVHGDEDKIVPVEQSERLVRVFPHADLKIMKGTDHFFKGHFDECMDLIVDFVTKQFGKG